MVLGTLKRIYEQDYKKLLAFSLLILLLAGGVLLYNKAATGEFVQKGVTLKGGITLTAPVSDVDVIDLRESLQQSLPESDITVRSLSSKGVMTHAIIEASDVTEEELTAQVSSYGIALVEGEYSVESMGSSLGQSFYRQTIAALLVAFLFMGVVVFLTFRLLVPSSFVMLAAVSDIVCTLAVISLLDVKLSTAGIAAFLMLIGYSVDTDILLTTRVMKRKEGTLMERVFGAMRTGLIMSCTSLIATAIAFFLTDSEVIRQIMMILSIGLIFDMVFTWFQNAGILRLWLEKRGRGTGGVKNE